MAAPVNLYDALSGNGQKVTKSNRALVNSAGLSYAAQVSWEKADAIYCTTRMITIPAFADVAPQNPGTAMEGYAFQWIRNDSPDKALVTHTVILTSDGGPSHDLGVHSKFTPAQAALPPTANAQLLPTCFRLNAGNGSAPPITSLAWDGVGNGLTMPAGSIDPTFLAADAYAGPGISEFNWGDTIISPPGSPFADFHVVDTSRLVAGQDVKFACIFLMFLINPSELYI